MMIKDPVHGSEYALRKHASEQIEESLGSDQLYNHLLSPAEARGSMEPGFREHVVQSLMEEFKQKRNAIMKEERNRSHEEQEAQRDRMKELLMRLFEGRDPAEALTTEDRQQFERMADLQALQSALAEFEVKWSVIMN